MSLDVRPMYRVLIRPNLIMGAERKAALTLLLAAGGLAALGQNIPSVAVAAGLWFIGMPLLVKLAKTDPQMIEIYKRSVKYRGYYAARSRPYRVDQKCSH